MAGTPVILRNIGIIAHIDAGKTTLSERILFYSNKIHRMGEVHEGAATMDFMPEEQERGITIAAACTRCQWGGAEINLVDTPGHVDFTVEVERCLRVLDGAVGVFCAVAGVEPQSETVWRQSEKFHIPKLAFVNKMDRPGASFAATLEAMRKRLAANPVAVAIPLGEGEEFTGILDVISQERVLFDPADQGRSCTRSAFTPDDAVAAKPWREKLLEAAADMDDEILRRYLAGEEIPADMLRAAIRAAVLAQTLVPVFAGSALRNIGVQPLMDGIVAFLPGPADTGSGIAPVLGKHARTGESHVVLSSTATPLCALVFKVLMDGGRKLVMLRIYSGIMREGDACRNVPRNVDEKTGRMYRLHAGRREQIDAAQAGDIVAVQGLRAARTGDTYADPMFPLLLEDIMAYTPVISLALEPKNTEEGKKLDEALERFLLEDPTLHAELDENSSQRIISGMGELHLEVLLDRMRRENGLAPRAGNPQVVLCESIENDGSGSGEFDRELGGQLHYGHVALAVKPLARGAENIIDCNAVAASVHRTLLEATHDGISDSLQCGPLGYAVRNVAVAVTGLGRKKDFASPPGCRMAAALALKHALRHASPILLEPIMEMDLTVPEPQVGAVISLLGTRNGKVEAMHDQGGVKQLKAYAPMRELFGFSTALRSATQGRAGFLMRFHSFDSV